MRSYMSNEEDETMDDEDTFPAFDDDDDDDYAGAPPPRKTTRRSASSTRGRAPARGQRAVRGESSTAARSPVQNMPEQTRMPTLPLYRGNPVNRILLRGNAPPMRYASTSYAVQENRPLKMVVFK